jgi:hypothetical protein
MNKKLSFKELSSQKKQDKEKRLRKRFCKRNVSVRRNKETRVRDVV